MVNSIRSDEARALLLDCGGFFPTRGLSQQSKGMIADLGFQAMNRMGYAAMNLGTIDFSLGIDFLNKVTSAITFPLVTSNLVYKESGLPFGKKYVIESAGDVKVGILGVMPADAFENLPAVLTRATLEIIPPEKALEDLIPEIKKKADIVILLSQCGLEATTLLVDNHDDIDLAIIGGVKKGELAEKKIPCGKGPEGEEPLSTYKKALVMLVGWRGQSLGSVRLTIDSAGQVIQRQGKMIPVNDSVAADERIAKITGEDIYKKIMQEKKMRKEKRLMEISREIEELRKLTPEEYIERQLKKESRAGGEK